MTTTMPPSPPSEMNYSPNLTRKRTASEAGDQHDQTFTLADLNSASSWTFEPVSRLLRAHLPLSWLAPTSSNLHNDIVPGTAVQGHVKNVATWDYAVLVARRIPNGGLVALEKIEDDYFVLYPLQPFVSEKWIQDASIGASPSASLQMMLHYLPGRDTDSSAHARRLSTPTAEGVLKVAKVRRGAAARLSILNLPCKTETPPESPSNETIFAKTEAMVVSASSQVHSNIPAVSSLHDRARPEEEKTNTPSEPQSDMLSPAYLRQRYQDHLYMTKTSLAYYTKGPLSRARARARAQDSSMTLADLATFYRNSLLPIKRMDLKYKETLPQFIDTTDLHASENTSRPTRRTKLGKNGLWPMEHDFVLRWWESKCSKLPTKFGNQSRDIRDAIASLRMREAQMQMILMLEALSIETKQKDAPSMLKPTSGSSDIKAESVEQDESPDLNKASAKKLRNLEADLELLADRLCIWHSVGLEGSVLSDHELSKEEEEDLLQSKDRLRNFCVDVLIPFYSARLPLLCKSLCKTLAGPDVFEQTQKTSRLKDIGKSAAPGTAVRRRVSSATGRNMERVVSEGGMPQASPPALKRSSTLPPLPKFQRETSELSHRPPSLHSRQLSSSFTNREIDLVADAQATASKKRKLDRVASHKQDLAAAIEALKKPNRHNVVSAYMDEVERRKSELKMNSVQIIATPQASRTATLDNAFIEPPTQPNFGVEYAVPASGTKSKDTGIVSSIFRSSSKKKAVLAAIHNTPSKAASRQINSRHTAKGAILDSASNRDLADDDTHVTSTPSKPKAIVTSSAISTSQKRVAKPSTKHSNTFELPDIALEAMDRAMTMPIASTIYDTLGWNDDKDT